MLLHISSLITPEPATVSSMGMGGDRIKGILLAAGASQRFGSDKQSTLVDGTPMLTQAARLLLDAGFVRPIIVLGPRASDHRALLAGLSIQLAENPNAASGMASSLRAGVDAAGDCDAIVVTVCDQPAVTAAHLRAMLTRWRDGSSTIVASRYSHTRGVPALFASAHFTELRRLEGDRGAGPILARYAATTAVVDLPDGALDIDTPADLTRFRQRRAER